LDFEHLAETTLMVHEEYKEMLSAHALAALDHEAAHALNEHLSQCAICREELDRWNASAAALALAANPAEPAPMVRERILDQIKAEANNAHPESTSKAVTSPQVLPFKQPPRNVWQSIGSLGAIAAAVMFTALLVSLIILWKQNREAHAELTKLSNETKSLQEDLARKNKALQMLAAPGTQMAELSATNMAPGASAKLAFDKNGHAMLMAKGLPAAPRGKAYQLWYIVGNKPMPGKVFTPDSAGNGVLEDQMPAVAMNSAVFAVTLEPASGMPTPTGAVYLQSGS
jgi:anti-sigma-K factor RskA